jgi:hypothetical protein
MKKVLLVSFVAAAVGLAVYSTSYSQMGGQGGGMMGMMSGGCPMMELMGGGMMGQGMGGQGMMGGGHMRMGAMAEGRLAYLKSALEITDSQTEAWNGYAETVRARVAKMQEMRSGMMDMMQKGTAIDRMDARTKGMQMMADAMGALKPATEKLYGVLTPEQKKVADELLGMGCGAM